MSSKLVTSVLAAFFPDQCTGCEQPLFAAETSSVPEQERQTLPFLPFRNGRGKYQRRWCADCWAELALADQLQCKFCGAGIRAVNPLGKGCPLCLSADLRFDQAVCLGNYTGLLRDVVIRMKNQRDDHMAVRLGQLLTELVSNQSFFEAVDFVVPVPTHWGRRLMRGFSAAEILAEPVAERAKLKISRRLVHMSRQTEKQGKLSIAKRRKNMIGAFELASKADVTGKTVLLIDDVMTSGATVSELAKCLKKAKAKNVYVAVVARGAGVL